MSINTNTSPYFPNDRNGVYIAIAALPGGATVDSIFYFNNPNYPVTDPVNSFLQKILTGIINGDSIGLYSTNTGSVNATRLNAALAITKVKGIVFDSINNINIPLSGTINCGGKKLSFRHNNFFSGTHTLDSGLLDCNIANQCFSVTTTLTNFRSVRKEVTFENFGAAGGGSDETLILQHTSDMLIANTSMPRNLKLLCGKSYGTQGWILHNWNGTDYGQFAINVVGEKSAFGGNTAFFPVIKQLNARGFGIGIQRATGVTIEGIGVQGPLNIAEGTGDIEYYSRDYVTFASNYGGSTKQFAPDTNIVIDPFRLNSTLPSDNGYDDWNGLAGVTAMNPTGVSWYRGTQTTAGSTAIKLRDLTLNGATALVCVSPNGQTEQCENMTFEDIFGNNCKAVYGFCQRESKNCVVKGGYSIDRTAVIFDGVTWGSQQGTLPYVEGYCTSGGVISLVNASAQHPVSFSRVYMENAFRIGNMTAGAGMVQFNSCNFSFNADTPIPYPSNHYSGLNTQFKGCTMRYYDDLFNKRLAFLGSGIKFEGCYFDQPPMSTFGYGPSGNQRGVGLEIKNCYYGSQGVIGWQSVKGYLNGGLTDAHLTTGPVTIENFDEGPPDIGGNTGRLVSKYDIGSFEQLDVLYHSSSYTVNTAAHTATFTAYFSDSPPVGCYIVVNNSDSDTNFKILGRVASVSGNVCSIVDVPVGFPNGAGTSTNSYGRAIYRIIRSRFIGTYTNSSSSITNCYGVPTIGSKDIYTQLIITGFSGTTATLSGGSTVTGRLYTPAADKEDITYYKTYTPYDDVYLPETTGYFPGDKWVFAILNNFYAQSSVIENRSFVCLKEGTMLTAIWQETFKGEFKDTAVLTADGVSTQPTGRWIRGILFSCLTAGMTINVGITSGGSEIWSGTLAPGTSQSVDWEQYMDGNLNIYITGVTGTGGTLILKFF